MNIASLIIALVGLVAWLEPKIGFFVSYLAFVIGFYNSKKQPSKLAKISMTLGVVGFVLSLVHLILSVTILR